ncbi:hypothetical protein JCM5350_008223 [Sporobolomyces pararoseus]
MTTRKLDSSTSEPPQPQTQTPSPVTPVASKPIKKANKPFLVHQKYKQEQANTLKKDKSSFTPSRPGPLFQVFKYLVLAISTSLVLSKAITQTWTWGYETRPYYLNSLNSFKHLLVPPRPELVLTEQELSKYNGINTNDDDSKGLPIYLAIDGDVYDVTEGRESYGPGGAYHIFAGRDAARAFVTGCFQTHLTHDLRGFNQKELATLKHWKEFYSNHAKYRKVGRVMHPPIDENSPIPEPCTPGKGGREQPGKGQVRG